MRDYRVFVWNSALNYLGARADMAAVREHMAIAETAKPDTLSRVYLRLLESLPNRQGMQNTIGSIEALKPIFYDFDPREILRHYSADWKMLFNAIETKVKPRSRMDMSNTHSHWVQFCKGSISGAQYLSRFATLDEFLQFVDDFDAKPNTRAALPLVIACEVFGFGFALACDFLKELGFSNYSKPDIHLTYIFTGLGLSQDSELDVFRAVSLLADEVEETPYAVDKAFWLIGSGKLYLQGEKFETSRVEFVELTTSSWKARAVTG